MSDTFTIPTSDFSQFGPIERVPLSTIQRLTGTHLTRNWTTIPHVFHHDDLDLTVLEAERLRLKGTSAVPTTLAIVIKALALTLVEQPKFNASLDANGTELIIKKYVNIGVAVDTPKGVLLPVVRGCEALSAVAIAAEIAKFSARARERGLPIDTMSGGTFSVSSLGKLGGTGFTPIINAPEVAILGLSAAQQRPMRGSDDRCCWRTVIPACLSYDHRVVNGVDAGRFMGRVKALLATHERLA